MDPLVLAFVGGVVLAGLAVLSFAWEAGTGSPRQDEVLPSHYSSLLMIDRTHYPGHCPNCGTDNEPGYKFCEACGGAIPTTDGAPQDVDIDWILDG